MTFHLLYLYHLFTVLMMVFEPVLIRVTGLGELIAVALIGGTVDQPWNVTVAGTALGETAQTAAVLVKIHPEYPDRIYRICSCSIFCNKS